MLNFEVSFMIKCFIFWKFLKEMFLDEFIRKVMFILGWYFVREDYDEYNWKLCL